MPERVLAVDSDPASIVLLETCICSAGYGISFVRDGSDAAAEARRQRPDIILTELDLHGIAGVEVCRRIRDDPCTTSTPIIVVTRQSDPAERIAAFEAGVDDYVTKPFSPRELVLRVRALLRRAQQGILPRPIHLRVGGLEIDVARRRVSVEGSEVLLTPIEFRLALYLASDPGHVRSRPELLEHVWQVEPDTTTRTIDTHVKRLREKLGSAGSRIETVARVGYRLRET